MPETQKGAGDAIEEFIERHLADAAEAIVEEDVAHAAASERLKRYVAPQPPAAILSPPISPAVGPSWLPTWLPSGFALVGCLVVALIIVGGGALLLLGGGLGPPPVGQASPTPSPTAMVAATETPTGSPPEAPTEVPTPTPTPTPEGKTNAFTPDETGDATTDSGAPGAGGSRDRIRRRRPASTTSSDRGWDSCHRNRDSLSRPPSRGSRAGVTGTRGGCLAGSCASVVRPGRRSVKRGG